MSPRRKSPAVKRKKTKPKPRKRVAAAAVCTPTLSSGGASVKKETKVPSSSSTSSTSTSSTLPPRDKYELAPTGRAKCQKCRKKIAIGSRRVGIHEISPRFGDVHRFYHDECYPAKQNLRLGGATPQQLIAQQLRERNQGIVALRERAALRQSLLLLRSKFAQRLHYAPFCVFSDATVDELVIKMPRTKEELLAVRGVGPKNYQSFGESFLQVINSFRSAPATSRAFVAKDVKMPPKKSRSCRLSTTAKPILIDLIDDDADMVNHQPKPSSTSSQNNTNNTIIRQRGLARTSVDMDDEALVMETLTIEQIVEQKFKHAHENGYVIAVDI